MTTDTIILHSEESEFPGVSVDVVILVADRRVA